MNEEEERYQRYCVALDLMNSISAIDCRWDKTVIKAFYLVNKRLREVWNEKETNQKSS